VVDHAVCSPLHSGANSPVIPERSGVAREVIRATAGDFSSLLTRTPVPPAVAAKRPQQRTPPTGGRRKEEPRRWACPSVAGATRDDDRMSSGCGRQEASTRLQPVRRLWLRAKLQPACRRVPAMPLDGDRGRAGRPLDGGLARRPALWINSRNGTAQDRRRRRTVERPSEAATGSSRRIVNRVRRDPAAARSRSDVSESRPGRAKPGGTLLTPTPAEHPCCSLGCPATKRCPPGEGFSFFGVLPDGPGYTPDGTHRRHP
jgi:hypothetical protein